MPAKKILVAYDGSAQAHKALDIAREIAQINQETDIVLVHVMLLYSTGSAASGIDAMVLGDAQEIEEELNQIASELSNNVEIKILKGTSPADLIVNYAKDSSCDLIIMGSRGKGGVTGYLGSVSTKVIRESPMTVIVAKEGA